MSGNPSRPSSPIQIACDPGSVSRLLGGLREGDEEAIRQLWNRFFRRLVALADSRLGKNLRQPVDPEDVALQAFHQFCQLMRRPDVDEKIPVMVNRENVWRVLARLTIWQALDYGTPPHWPVMGGGDALEQIPARECAIPASAEFTEEVANLLNELHGRTPEQTARLRRLAMLKLDGKTNSEAARELGCGVDLVGLLLQAIRKLWEKHDPRPPGARRNAPPRVDA